MKNNTTLLRTKGRKIAVLITGFVGRCVHKVAKEIDMEQLKIIENYKGR
jgi:lactate dehydrogenase-like 2-hydroxyacid dehydrogenase